MKNLQKIILFAFYFFLVSPAFGRDEEQTVKFKAQYCGDTKQPFMSYGIQYEAYMDKKFSLGYDFMFGYIPNEGLTFQTGASQSLGAILFALNDPYIDYDDYLAGAALICMIIPNELAYTVKESGRVAIRPYIKPLDIALFPNSNSCIFKPFDLSTEIGVKLRIQPGKYLEFAPQIGMKRYYFSKRSDFMVSFNAGIRF